MNKYKILFINYYFANSGNILTNLQLRITSQSEKAAQVENERPKLIGSINKEFLKYCNALSADCDELLKENIIKLVVMDNANKLKEIIEKAQTANALPCCQQVSVIENNKLDFWKKRVIFIENFSNFGFKIEDLFSCIKKSFSKTNKAKITIGLTFGEFFFWYIGLLINIRNILLPLPSDTLTQEVSYQAKDLAKKINNILCDDIVSPLGLMNSVIYKKISDIFDKYNEILISTNCALNDVPKLSLEYQEHKISQIKLNYWSKLEKLQEEDLQTKSKLQELLEEDLQTNKMYSIFDLSNDMASQVMNIPNYLSRVQSYFLRNEKKYCYHLILSLKTVNDLKIFYDKYLEINC